MKHLVLNFIEKRLGFYLARHPHEKYFNHFVETSHSELIRQCRGVLHIGAHLGTEGEFYNLCKKPTIFIEADPRIFQQLQRNLSNKHEQVAYNYLLGNENKKARFFRASNDSQSSSLLPFSSEKSFGNVQMLSSIELDMVRIDQVFRPGHLDKYDHWVIDVQGAELLVLEGAGDLLSKCKTLFIECSTREFYKGGVLWPELSKFLQTKGFKYFVTPGNLEHLNILFFRN